MRHTNSHFHAGAEVDDEEERTTVLQRTEEYQRLVEAAYSHWPQRLKTLACAALSVYRTATRTATEYT